MARKKQYRDRYGRFAKRGQPLKPAQPRTKGRFISRPAPLRLGVNRQGKRYWIQSRRPTKKRGRIIEQGGIISGPTRPRGLTDQDRKSINDLRETSSVYGYKLEDFLSRPSHPEGYSYVTFHIFYTPWGSDRTGGKITTLRGRQYNTPDDLRKGVEEELEEILGPDYVRPGQYLYTVVQVIPQSGVNRVPGSVYPEDYHPKERPGTREYEIEQGKSRAKRFWESGRLE